METDKSTPETHLERARRHLADLHGLASPRAALLAVISYLEQQQAPQPAQTPAPSPPQDAPCSHEDRLTIQGCMWALAWCRQCGSLLDGQGEWLKPEAWGK